MRQIFAKIAIAGLIALGGIGSVAAPAFAGSLQPEMSSDSIVNVQYREEHRRYGDERDWRRPERRGNWDRPRDVCSPGLASEKAFRMGLNRVRVVDVTPRRVVVEGRRHGRMLVVTFANVRGCPVRG